jgi:hypothetical protein
MVLSVCFLCGQKLVDSQYSLIFFRRELSGSLALGKVARHKVGQLFTQMFLVPDLRPDPFPAQIRSPIIGARTGAAAGKYRPRQASLGRSKIGSEQKVLVRARKVVLACLAGGVVHTADYRSARPPGCWAEAIFVLGTLEVRPVWWKHRVGLRTRAPRR